MTSPAEPASGDAAPASHPATPARQLTDPLRELIAFVLLGANAVLLFVGLIQLLAPTDYSTFYSRAGSSFFSFAGLEATVLPVLAVLLATHVAPVVPRARLITQVALGQYAFGALLGVLTLLIWTVDRLAKAEVLDAFLGLLTRIVWLAIFATAAFVVVRIWRALYFTPKPKPAPGMYGQPQPGWPQQPQQQGQPGPQGGWAPQAQQGGWPAPGQQAGYPAPNQPGGQFGQPGQPGPVAGQYGQPGQQTPPFAPAPQSAPPYSAPPFTPPYSAPPFTPPQSAPPFPAPAPQSAPSFGQPPSADPTQAIPRQPTEPGTPGGQQDSDSDRTQRFHRED